MDPSKIRLALDRLLADPEFRVSDRNKSFLRFVVEETLAGREGRIKSYTIAVDVFGRDASFDAASDPIVRIEASRLRAGLDAYYAMPGRPVEIRFNLPKGGYVPLFQTPLPEQAVADETGVAAADNPEVDAPPVPVADDASASPRQNRSSRHWPERWLQPSLAHVVGLLVLVLVAVGAFVVTQSSTPQPPVLVVSPVDALAADEPTRTLARTLGTSLKAALGQYEGMHVALPGDTRTASLVDGARVVFALKTTVRIDGGTLRLGWQLINAQTLEVLWSATASESVPADDGQAVARDIAFKVARLVAYRSRMPSAE